MSKTDKVFAHQGLIRDRMGSQTINKEAIKANFRRQKVPRRNGEGRCLGGSYLIMWLREVALRREYFS